MKERMKKIDGKEREILKSEIEGEEVKIKIQKFILTSDERLAQLLSTFNRSLEVCVELMTNSAYPFDAKPYLAQARVILIDVNRILEEIKLSEGRLIDLTKMEKHLLKKERQAA